ncbi:hypothetical protein XENTR_v10008711 [Xenopus tropicalis]|nr:hypothetical protein XENTR_v10008711 [Xenopus tropicalis]
MLSLLKCRGPTVWKLPRHPIAHLSSKRSGTSLISWSSEVWTNKCPLHLPGANGMLSGGHELLYSSYIPGSCDFSSSFEEHLLHLDDAKRP